MIMTLRHKLLLTILVLTLFLGVATTASAAMPETRSGLLRGKVTTIAGESLTLQTHRGEVRLLTDEGTAFDLPGIEDAGLDDLAVGDFVVVRVVRGEDGAALARHVAVVPNGSLEDETLRGIVTAVDGETFETRIRRGKVTVVTDENTLFRIPKVEDATAADVKEKMPVIVLGQYEAEDEQAFHAKAVAVIPGRILRRHLVRGELTAIEGDTLVIVAPGRDADEGKRVRTTDETRFRVPGVEDATLDDLKVGDRIAALGGKDESGDFVAKIVAVVPRRPRRIVVRGEVTAMDEGSFTLETPHRREVTVIITGETRFHIPGDDDPALDDIAVGDRVGVIGHKDRDGNLVARGVGKLPQEVRRQVIWGEVTDVEGTTLQVDTSDGPVTVHTDENTRFHIPGDDDPGLDDIAVGDWIAAAGRWNANGSLQARVVGKPRRPGQTRQAEI
jgi:hypothetical protein